MVILLLHLLLLSDLFLQLFKFLLKELNLSLVLIILKHQRLSSFLHFFVLLKQQEPLFLHLKHHIHLRLNVLLQLLLNALMVMNPFSVYHDLLLQVIQLLIEILDQCILLLFLVIITTS
jgi:hypothetical protein